MAFHDREQGAPSHDLLITIQQLSHTQDKKGQVMTLHRIVQRSLNTDRVRRIIAINFKSQTEAADWAHDYLGVPFDLDTLRAIIKDNRQRSILLVIEEEPSIKIKLSSS